METLEQLESQIEELEAEIEEQIELIKKFEDDQNENGTDHTSNIREARKIIHNLKIEIKDIQYRIDTQDYAVDYEN
jgi:hypothetical protein